MAQVATDVLGSPTPGTPGDVGFAPRARGPWELFWMRLKQDRAALGGAVFIFLLVLVALLAPVIAGWTGHGPNDLFIREMTDDFGLPAGPNSEFWFGADSSGRDLFVRVLYGARTSLLVAVFATGVAVGIGVILGTLAGFYGGKLDTLISRAIDIILSLPLLLFAIGITAVCSTSREGCIGGLIKPGLPLVVFVISLFSWPYIARIVRGNTLSMKEKEFIEASRSLGAGDLRIIVTEVMPNLVAPIIVYTTLFIPNNIVFEASLSYLGLGVPQNVPSWGRMLSEASQIFEVAWWLMFFPGLFLFATTMAFNLLGDGLRDALDPRTGR
jgi:peptide/nickel transport system permease protein